MNKIKRPYEIIHNIVAIVILLLSVIFLYATKDSGMILNAFIWATLIGISFLFSVNYNGEDLSVGGIFSTCIAFIFKWYYIPLIFVFAYIIYTFAIGFTKGIKGIKEKIDIKQIIYSISDFIIIESICSQMLIFFIPYGQIVLKRDISALLFISVVEAILSMLSMMIRFKEKGQIDSIIVTLIEDLKNSYEICLVTVPYEILLAIMYLQNGFIGVALTSSFVLVLQFLLSKQIEKNRIEEEGYIDVLTGVRNKKYYIEKLPELFDDSCAIFFIDFNGFKKVNDTYGHEIGDRLIIHGADILNKAIRDKDEIIRFGGDEFMLLIKNADRGICKSVINRIENLCDEMIFKQEDIEIKISLSAGVAICPEESNSKEELTNMADDKMYKAKHDKNKEKDIVRYII